MPVIVTHDNNPDIAAYKRGYDEAVLAERERCAKIAERYEQATNQPGPLVARAIAAEIREGQ